MSTAKSLVRNTGILVAGELLSRALSLVLIVVIARTLNESGLGKYSFVFAFVGIFSIFSDLGSTLYITKEIARNNSLAKEYLGKVFVAKLILAAISSLVPILIIFLTGQAAEIKAGVMLAAAAMFMYYIAFPFRAVVNAYEVQSYQSLYVLAERLIAFALGTFVLFKGYGLTALLIVLVFSNASSWLIICRLVSKNLVGFKPQLDWAFIKSVLKKSSPFWFTTIFMTIYFKIDTVMLSFMQDYAVTGLYNAAYKIIDTLAFIPFVVVTVAFPVMSKFHKKDAVMLSAVYKKSFYYLSLLALPLGIGVTVLAERIILLIYDKSFINSAIALQILIWALVLMFVNYLMGFLLNSIDKQKAFTLVTGLTAAFNVILNLIIIPVYSYKGAAIATVSAELFNFFMLFYFSSKSGFFLNPLKLLFKPLIASLIMGALILAAGKYHLLLVVPLAIACYFSVLFMIKGLGKEEISLIKSFF
ncbi:flippase [Candidatus Woesearchaeota archaeon]|nr:flippase [Candidatus Woesearchaeota archaeon]